MTVDVNELITELAKYSEPRSIKTQIAISIELFDTSLQLHTALLIDKTISALKNAADSQSVLNILIDYAESFFNLSYGQTGLKSTRSSGWFSPSRSQKITNQLFTLFGAEGVFVLQELKNKHDHDVSNKYAAKEGCVCKPYLFSSKYNAAVKQCEKKIHALHTKQDTITVSPS